MKKIMTLAGFGILLAISTSTFTGCATAREAVDNKSGAQIWGENCVRCHNSPSPSAYNDIDWETIGMHMRIRANLTAVQIDKVVEFMQSAN